jgi:phosphoglycolate phosphatase
MPYRLVLWDFDGTLADSLALSLAIFNQLAQKWSFEPIRDVQMIRRMSVGRFLKEHRLGLLKLPALMREFHEAGREGIAEVKLYPGVARVLRLMREAGLRLGILSSNSRQNIQSCLRTNGVADLFEFIAGGFHLFGKAAGIRRAVRQSSLPRQQVLYVGDELRDITAARKADVHIAAVSWGLNDQPTLAAAEPTYQVSTPEALLPIVDVADAEGHGAQRTILTAVPLAGCRV